MKVWYISTWGGGTPNYLVSAETKEKAWELVEKEWRKLNIGYDVGDLNYPYKRDRNFGRSHQDISDLIEVSGFNNDKEYIVDLNKIYDKTH